MTRQSKNYSHIWDNVMGTTNHHYHSSSRDTTGSSISIVDYSREEVTVISSDDHHRNPSIPRHVTPTRVQIPTYPPKVLFVGKSKKSERKQKHAKDGFVTNWDRECAQQPKQLAPWTFQAAQKPMYDTCAASRAFDDYARRLAAKKQKLDDQLAIAVAKKQKKRRVTINEAATEIVKEDNVPRSRSVKSRGEKLNMNTRRNDDIKIDTYCKTRTTIVDSEVEEQVDVNVKKIQMRQPGFYGTIEAEKCAERVAGHISAAAEHLERLKFVAEAVIPDSALHLKKLQEIGDEVKDFNSQMRRHRVKVPKSTGLNQVAHFVITESCAD